ncbi:exopolysaccharide biosynthesis protein [Phenylobacterium sp.]|jgi:hypothetical protein|uniref:exopolysaccharide biosynthesis protein n=1 Tax=Phenylobacterium sp. TaxID=1871053 RepID=UPI0012136258|nr:exopolysaccharide biosynthesis protein [Phenylobacterium sp.]THD60157.1 MAG: exopolysaccharide biosynthesis protein [Phenylobacterium sp.]
MAVPRTRSAQSLSGGLRGLMGSRKARLSVGEIIKRFEGKNGLGPVLFVLTLPILVPLPPGASMVLALPLLVVAPQVAAGRAKLWLPKWLSARTLDHKPLAKLIGRILPLLERLEALGRPRLSPLTGGAGTRLVGVVCTLLALVLVLPIPFANLFPALALGMFALGLTRRDGLMVLAGYGFIGLQGVIIDLGAHGVMAIVHHAERLI